MKLLVDACVPKRLAEALRTWGHDAVWVGDWDNPAVDDAVILAAAYAEGRTVVTLDKDFGELAVTGRHAHRGIVRLLEMPPAEQMQACRSALERHEPELLAGAVLTVTSTRIRIRQPVG